MPEHGFTRPPRSAGTSHIAAAAATAQDGGRLDRAHPVLMLVLAIAFVTGMWAEGSTVCGRRISCST
jgi:hypothetical protein